MPNNNAVSQGQNGLPIKLSVGGLNAKERLLLLTLVSSGGVVTIAELAKATGWTRKVGLAKANSWVRNSLRRLVRAGLVQHGDDIGDGSYRASPKGRKGAKAEVRS